MRRLWLLFAQTVTIALALWFVVASLRPDWFRLGLSSNHNLTLHSATLKEAPRHTMDAPNSYHTAANAAMPSVVNITSIRKSPESNQALLNDPFFKRFFGDSIKSKSERASSSGSGVIMSQEGYILTS
jgi:serine protease DegQ